MRVEIPREVLVSLRHLNPLVKKALRLALRELPVQVESGRGPLAIKELVTPHIQRIYHRVQVGTYRIVYRTEGDTVIIERIFPRRDGYDWMGSLEL